MAKRYKVKSLAREKAGFACYVVRTGETDSRVSHQWAKGRKPPSELPAREAMHSLMQLKRDTPAYRWELEACDD